jgi:predicted ATPase
MAQDCCPEGVVSTLKDRVGGSAATVATAISDPSDSSFNVSSSPRGSVDGGTADGTKKNPSVSDHGDGRCTSSSKRSPKKALRGSMEEKLSATKRAMQRMTPNLETRMSEQGFTIHKLDLPEGLFSSEQGQASKSCSSGSSAKAVSISSSSNPKQAVTLYGREKEISELSNALDSCCKVAESENTSKKFHIVMIAGESGVGKSALAKQLKYTRHLNNDGSYFCMGKYDVSDEVGGAPLTGISTALASFSRQIMSSTDEEQERVRNCVRKFFGLDEQQPSKNAKDGALVPAIPVEFQTLSDFVPNLANISNLDLSNTSSMSQKSGSSNKTQLQVLLHRFFQAICSAENPVVLVLDDLQWADKASLDLIQGLVREKAIPGFLVVGCYRSNEVTKEHALANVIESIENNKKHISLTTIEIGNLSFADIQMLTSTALHDQYASQEQLEGLSSVLQKKTAGNPYFLILFLKKLQKTGALKYNIGLMTWQWDNEAISHGMDVTENVAEFIRKNLESSISIAASCLLQIGACLGNVFEESLIILLTTRLVKDPSTTAILCSGASTSSETLEVLLKDNPSESEICEGLQKGLQECVEGGYLCTNSMEESSSTVFRFVHDKVQEAALSLIAAEAIPKLRYCIGSIMINDLSTEKLEENLFIAVDCINSSDMILRDQLGARKFLDLNIRAGEKAMLTSAFEAAVVYFHEAQSTLEHIEKMEALSWVDAPDLRCLGLQLFNKACIADFSAGNIEGCMLHINQVLEKRSLQIEDQLVVYSVLSAVRTAQEKHSEEYKTTMAVLKQLGVKFPPNFALNLGALVADLRKTKSVIGDRDVQAFINLPLMDDPICALKMKLMDRAQVCVSLFMGV